MVEDLRRQGAQLKPQTCEDMQERDDPWGKRDATSIFKEVGNSAETKSGGARPQRLFRCWISLAHSKDLDEHFHNRYGFTAISNGFQRAFVLENGQNPGLFAPG
jgi:hypothetical protein